MMKATRALPWMTLQNKWKKYNTILQLNFCKPHSLIFHWLGMIIKKAFTLIVSNT